MRNWLLMMAGVSLAALGQGVAAQTVAAPAASQAGGGSEGAEAIIVTARRSTENLQDVPQTVNVVSGEAVKKLNFTQFQDVAAAVPGLTLNTGAVTAGGVASPSVRGVSYDASTTPSPTVDIYVNEVPTGANVAFTSVYDIGGVEVLKGPQGTLRGRSAPSGAILMNSRRANTTDWGGYVSGLATDHHAINGQAALNVPVVSGLLGVRVAGVVDQGDGNFIRSVNKGPSPYRNTTSGRVSLAFTPASNLSANLVYQYTNEQAQQYVQVAGTGAPGGVAALAPANYNGPAINPSDRAAAARTPNINNQRIHQVTGNITWNVLGHSLQYVGGYLKTDSNRIANPDYGNAVPGATLTNIGGGPSRFWTHEIRLSSTGKGHLIDYSLGYFHNKSDGTFSQTGPAAYLSGSFGLPTAPSPFTYNPRYTLSTAVYSDTHLEENSFYGNATLHLGSRTDINAGARYIINKSNQSLKVFLGGGNIAQRIPAPCALIGFTASPYAGYCDIPIAANPSPILNSGVQNTTRPFVYNASIRHRFSQDILAYATVGSSWRRGGTNTGIINAAGDPYLSSLAFTPDEKSTSYEAGLKTTFFDKRLRLNLSGFYQKYKNLVFQVTSIPYLQTDGQTTIVANSNFVVGADATVKGFDLDGGFEVSRSFNIGFGIAYADGKVDNSKIPCRDSNFDGVEDTGSPTVADFRSRGVYVAQCKSNRSVSRDPLWNATIQSELHLPVSQYTDGYVRALVNYYPSNSRASDGYVVSDYALVNLYTGFRSADGRWDLSVFLRNATNAGVQLSRDPSLLTTAYDNTFGSAGYRFVTYTPPRQLGVSIRYQFGSR